MAENIDYQPPGDLANAYIDITSDLAFAQTHYPEANITAYLNDLAGALHNGIYRNKREPWSRLVTFWTREVPLVMWDNRRLLLASLLVMAVGYALGWISQMVDTDICYLFFGDGYMAVTEQNILNGRPMDIYGAPDKAGMFLDITINNVGVAIKAFVFGIMTSFATGWLLLSNGFMLGVFDCYFSQHDLLAQCLLTSNLHGTLEMSAIIVAGAAGLASGNGWLFPGTYSRAESLKRGAKNGLKIMVGTVPLFIVAAFIESYITRHYLIMPDGMKVFIIGCSLIFVLFYYLYLPWLLHRRTNAKR